MRLTAAIRGAGHRRHRGIGAIAASTRARNRRPKPAGLVAHTPMAIALSRSAHDRTINR
jgi:hypothetical protein